MIPAPGGFGGPVPVRQLVLVDLLSMIAAVRPGERALIAIDGVDGVGKSYLAGELLALAPHVLGRQVEAVSIDGFQHPRAVRHARGTGPEQFYFDSYDYEAFQSKVVEPFRARGEACTAIWDVAADAPAAGEILELDDDGILLVEGIFMHRPELAGVWDASLWVDAPFDITVPRGNSRFPARAHLTNPESPELARYVEGQRFYMDACLPAEKATWVMDNSDLNRPQIVTVYDDE